jgi:hypothetical protein
MGKPRSGEEAESYKLHRMDTHTTGRAVQLALETQRGITGYCITCLVSFRAGQEANQVRCDGICGVGTGRGLDDAAGNAQARQNTL